MKKKDYILYQSGCGNRGDCLYGVYAGCGDDRFRIVYSPEYFPDLPKVVPRPKHWADLTYTERSNANDPDSAILGIRLQYHEGLYQKNYSESEYRDLFKKARAGKNFAQHQLVTSFYTIHSQNEDDLRIQAVKSLGMDPALIKMMVKNKSLSLDMLPLKFRDDKETILLFVNTESGICCSNEIELLSERLRDDLDLMRKIAKKNPHVIKAASERVRKALQKSIPKK